MLHPVWLNYFREGCWGGRERERQAKREDSLHHSCVRNAHDCAIEQLRDVWALDWTFNCTFQLPVLPMHSDCCKTCAIYVKDVGQLTHTATLL